MRRRAVSRLAFFAIAVWFVLSGSGITVEPAQARTLTSIVVEHETGRVLSQSGADKTNYPASLTKMMTLYLAFDELRKGKLALDTGLKVSRHAASMPPSKLGLRAGNRIRLEDAIRALVVKSANDVAVVVAESIGGTESQFAERMTKKARQLGMASTVFRNASGLPNSRQKTTARDMVTLARRLVSDFPEYYPYFGTKQFAFRGRTYRSHNNLMMTYAGMDGLKTGYIRASGYNLASSAVRNGRRVIGVVLGGNSAGARNAAMAKLLDNAFEDLQASPPLIAAAPVPAPREMLVASVSDSAAVEIETPLEIGGDYAPEERTWGVQVGAFSSRTSATTVAHRAWAMLPDLLADGKVEVSRGGKRAKRLYLSRVLGIDRDTANEACRALKQRSMDCMVLANP